MRLPHSKQGPFEAFAAEHGDGLVKLAFALSGDRERAQDATQEALVRVYQRWSRLENPLAYARRTVVNVTRDGWRRGAREDRANQAAHRERSPESEHPQDRLPERDALMTALATLPHGQRAVIVLRYGTGLTEAETAAALDISTGTVKSQTARALARLREVLGAELVLHPTEAR